MVDGGSPCAGTVQVYHWGIWWTTIPYFIHLYDHQNAPTVIGRELGCGPLEFFGGPEYFTHVKNNLLASEHICNGSESKIFSCETNFFVEAEVLSIALPQLTFTGRNCIQ